MSASRISHHELVKVSIIDANGNIVANHIVDTFNSIPQAIQETFNASSVSGTSIMDYVFRFTDLSTGATESYRINAGGHARLLE